MIRPVGRAREPGPVAVIGDIHGRLDLLDALLEKVGELPLFVIGDVIDRGPDSAGVVSRLVERGARGVIGNHESWLLAWLDGAPFDDIALHPSMGGAATLASYGLFGADEAALGPQRGAVPAAHQAWLRSLPVALDLEAGGARFWLVHGGVPTSVPLPVHHVDEVVPWLAQHRPDDLLWASHPPADSLPVDRPVVMGHVRMKEPVDLGFVVGVDTGCGKPRGRLTAVILPERRFVTVG